jgi:pilus assembly protein Flp/PilA
VARKRDGGAGERIARTRKLEIEREKPMRNLVSKHTHLLKEVQKDQEGAALIEYTVLLGILLVAVIVTIGLVGTWISGKWTALQGQLS